MPDQSLDILKYVWMILSLPIAWIWNRINANHKENKEAIAVANGKADEAQRKLDEHKLYVANNHFKKEEVERIVKKTIDPVNDSLKRIETNMQTLIDRELNKGG